MKKLVGTICLLLYFVNNYGQPEPSTPKIVTYNKIGELRSFKGYQERQGVMLQPTEANIAVSIVAKDQYFVIVLNKCITDKPKVSYEILDTAVIGKVSKDEVVITTDCRINQKADDHIIAVVKDSDQRYYKNVVKAWRVNRKTNCLEQINTNGIDCINEGFDL